MTDAWGTEARDPAIQIRFDSLLDGRMIRACAAALRKGMPVGQVVASMALHHGLPLDFACRFGHRAWVDPTDRSALYVTTDYEIDQYQVVPNFLPERKARAEKAFRLARARRSAPQHKRPRRVPA